MSRLKRIRTKINKENLEKAQKEGHITEDQAQEVIDTNGLYNPYTDTYINPSILPEISVTAKAPERTWTSEWTYNDPEFRLAREHRNIAAQEVAKSTRDKMNQVGNAIGKTIIGGTSFTPLWFAAPIAKSGIAASEGDYSGAAKEAAVGLLAPYAIGKGLEKGYGAYQAYRGWQNGLKEGVAHAFSQSGQPVRTTNAIAHTPTDRVYSLLGRSSKQKTIGTQYADLTDAQQAILNDLKSQGVETTNLTQQDLETLYELRLSALAEAAPKDWNLVRPYADGKSFKITGMHDGRAIGNIEISGPVKRPENITDEAWNTYLERRPGFYVDFVRNLTKSGGKSTQYDPRIGLINHNALTQGVKISGVQERMTNAGIDLSKEMDNVQGVMSGLEYLTPQASVPMLGRYADKVKISDNGIWRWSLHDPLMQDQYHAPVYLLRTSTYSLPQKSYLFDVNTINNGRMTPSFNIQNMKYNQGGKLNYLNYIK